MLIDHKQQRHRPAKNKTSPSKADASRTVELLDFGVHKSVIFKSIAREITHEYRTESSCPPADLIRLHAANVYFYIEGKTKVKSPKLAVWGMFRSNVNNCRHHELQKVKKPGHHDGRAMYHLVKQNPLNFTTLERRATSTKKRVIWAINARKKLRMGHWLCNILLLIV